MELVFATNNVNKLEEVRSLMGKKIKLLSLNDIGCKEELPETSDTLPGNAFQKAEYIYEKYGKNCFADDTGLEVDVLNGAPGVFSARYAGESKSSEANIEKLLFEMQGKSDRKARFKTVIALIIDGERKSFEGVVDGSILEKNYGSKGFGYDPVFVPEGYASTFAEMDLSEKNKISHRGIAIKKLTDFLTNEY